MDTAVCHIVHRVGRTFFIEKMMYCNKYITGTCNSIHFRYNVLDG